jgi:hypothetical protein
MNPISKVIGTSGNLFGAADEHNFILLEMNAVVPAFSHSGQGSKQYKEAMFVAKCTCFSKTK